MYLSVNIKERLPIQREYGFTLLELVAAISIISILMTIAYPVYTNHILKANRSQAHIALLNMAAGMERYYVLHHHYEGATLAHLEINAHTKNQNYELRIEQAGENTYQLKAIPQNAQRQDNICGTLSLDEKGHKGVSGTGKVEACL